MEKGRHRKSTADIYRRPRALRNYYGLEKRLADSGAFNLLWDCGEVFSATQSIFYRHISGWSFAEAALISTDESLEDRHALLELASNEWQTAHDLQLFKDQQEDTEAYRHFLHSPELLRIEASQATTEMFSAMLDGDITPDIRQHYYENLLETAVRASDGVVAYTDENGWQYRLGSSYIGIAHELNAMLVLNRLQSPTLMAFPAIARADSGVNFPRQTHDISLLNMKWGAIKRSLPIEVKTTPNEKHFDRYDAVVVGGTMHMHPDHGRDPSYLTELLVKEHKNIISDEELTTLNTITQRVLHATKHGLDGTPQCRGTNECIMAPSERRKKTVAA